MTESERLILREFKESDAEDVLEYLKEQTVDCFLSLRVYSVDGALAAIKKKISHTEYCFAIVIKDTNKVIGEIEAFPERPDPEDTTSPIDTFSLSWMLNKAYQGKGYAAEAAHAFFDFLFYNKNARRIYAYTADYNLSCQHLCERLGMRREGVSKEFISFIKNSDGTPHYENAVQYAILKKEWNI